MLYKWYTSQSKVNNTFSKLKMPSKIKQNEFYDIKKTYKTNPTLLYICNYLEFNNTIDRDF